MVASSPPLVERDGGNMPLSSAFKHNPATKTPPSASRALSRRRYGETIRFEEFHRIALRAKLNADAGCALQRMRIDELYDLAQDRGVKPQEWSPFLRTLQYEEAATSPPGHTQALSPLPASPGLRAEAITGKEVKAASAASAGDQQTPVAHAAAHTPNAEDLLLLDGDDFTSRLQFALDMLPQPVPRDEDGGESSAGEDGPWEGWEALSADYKTHGKPTTDETPSWLLKAAAALDGAVPLTDAEVDECPEWLQGAQRALLSPIGLTPEPSQSSDGRDGPDSPDGSDAPLTPATTSLASPSPLSGSSVTVAPEAVPGAHSHSGANAAAEARAAALAAELAALKAEHAMVVSLLEAGQAVAVGRWVSEERLTEVTPTADATTAAAATSSSPSTAEGMPPRAAPLSTSMHAGHRLQWVRRGALALSQLSSGQRLALVVLLLFGGPPLLLVLMPLVVLCVCVTGLAYALSAPLTIPATLYLLNKYKIG